MSDKSIEQIEQERLNRLVGGKMRGAEPQAGVVTTNTGVKKWTPPPQQKASTQQQPQKVWKYQQKQQQTKSIYSGPPMDLSTRVNFLNSLLDQGSIDEQEYEARSQDLQTVAAIVGAVSRGNASELKSLLDENGHLLAIIYENESNIIHLTVEAIMSGKAGADCLRVILDHANVDVNSVRKGYTPLLTLCANASNSDCEEAITLLCHNGADVNKGAILKEGEKQTITPIAAAVTSGASPEVIKTLCQRGADPNTTTEDGPALNYCIIYGKNEEARVLLEHGANPNSREFQQGATCLASAVFEGNVEMVKLLLKHGADRNAGIIRGQQVTPKALAGQLKSKNPAIATIEQLL
jgi:ankyrin repeat protein